MGKYNGMTSVEAMQRNQSLTPQEVARRQREFCEVTEPIRKRMMMLALLQPFELTVVGGVVESKTLWRPEHKKAYDHAQELIAFWAEKILEQGR